MAASTRRPGWRSRSGDVIVDQVATDQIVGRDGALETNSAFVHAVGRV
jgi:hypothetical protein